MRREKKIIGARDNPIRFSQTMIPGNEGQQELCNTVLGTNEADKMDIASGRSLRTSMRAKRRIFWFWVVSQQKCGCMEVERINE